MGGWFGFERTVARATPDVIDPLSPHSDFISVSSASSSSTENEFMIPIFRYSKRRSQFMFVAVMDNEEARMRYPLGD